MSKIANKSGQGSQVDSSSIVQPLPTQQFGVTLQFIKEHNNGQVIPPIVSLCVEYLSQPDGILLNYLNLSYQISNGYFSL